MDITNPLYIQESGNTLSSNWLTESQVHTSDAREKTDVDDLIYGLETVLLMRPVSYQWKNIQNQDNLKNFGFIAQEMEMVAPDIVRTVKSYKQTGQERLGIRPIDLIPILVNAVKELDEKLEKLQKTKS